MMMPARKRFLRLAWACALGMFLLPPLSASAAPSRVIILRHGEKQDDYRLCAMGVLRAEALAGRYLGRGAAESLFTSGDPAAFFAITLHTLELAGPAAASWGLPLTIFAALPGEAGKGKSGFRNQLNVRTREAAAALMDDPRWAGKTVVMVWEHHHIADARLVADNPGREVTLRQLLKLDRLPGVPETWPDQNYDYFWIVDFAPDGTPTGLVQKKQVFEGAFAKVPSNDWGAPDGLGKASGCLK